VKAPEKHERKTDAKGLFDYTESMPTIPDSQPSELRIAVVGGGAAGFFAALNTAEKNPNARITIYEASHKPLQKVFISGGGRCNLTHACFDPIRLSEYYPRGQKELRSLFSRFQPKDTVTWFENRGLPLKTENDNRVFPKINLSQAVIDLFLDIAEKYRIQICTQSRVESIQIHNGKFVLQVKGKPETFDACILSTGYSPPGWKLAESLGHTILPPVPSLFPLTIKTPVIEGLQGISLPLAAGKLITRTPNGKTHTQQAEGALLITHTGLSGPLIYRLSAWGARELAESRYQAQIQLDLVPHVREPELRQQLEQLFYQTDARKKVDNTTFSGVSNRLWLSLLADAGVKLDERCETISKKAFNVLIDRLKRLQLPVTGKSPSKEEFVSCGGVLLKEINFKTMQSRLVPNLYFGGEILNIDGLTGGFNFQACWSEGWAISEALKASPA
jgi:predicted Rossmann fold flavoprotein